MASEVSICNLALAHLGNKANVSSISPLEGSAEAVHCARFYPIARDALLEMHEWRFATTRANLAQLTNSLDSWQFAYALPANCVRPISVLLPGCTDDTKVQGFMVETDAAGNGVVYTNIEDAVMRYTIRVVDTGKFAPLFIVALSWLLASHLAGPITKDPKVQESAYKMFLAAFNQAMVKDANSKRDEAYGSKHTAPWISAR